MFPTQNFSVKITDEKLIDSKRGTIKKSARTRNYSLMKTASSIFISPAEPLSRKDYFFGFIESKVDLTNEKSGEYQVKVGLKKMLKGIYLVFIPFVLLRLYQLITLPNPSFAISDVLPIIFFPVVLLLLYFQTRKGIQQMEERLREDKSIFAAS